MTDQEFKRLTSSFKDVKQEMKKLKTLKKKEMGVRRRLNTLNNKYSFLQDMVDLDATGDKVSGAIKKYFKELGFKKVELVYEKLGVEDIKLSVRNMLIIMEITGTKAKVQEEDKSHQISKHIPIRQAESGKKKVFGLFISNHDNKTPYGQRNTKPFTDRQIAIAKSHSYTMTTTTDLFNAFIKIKKGKLTANNLIKKLTLTGEYKELEV